MAQRPKESLTPERFAQVRAIFEAAEERPVAERFAFAAGACGADRALLLEVEAMLAAREIIDHVQFMARFLRKLSNQFPADVTCAARHDNFHS